MKKKKVFGTILHILNILKAYTDNEHLITQNQIVKLLRTRGIICRRYTIEKCLDELKQFGYEIVSIKGVGTYLKNDDLNPADVFVLLQGLKRANFILEKDYLLVIENKLKKRLNEIELEQLNNINMII